MKKILIRAAAACAALLCFVSCVLAETAGKNQEDYDPLWKLAEPYGFRLGGSFGMQDMGNKAFMSFLERHFNSLTCTNETKAYSLLDQTASKLSADRMPRMDYTWADRMVGWAAARGIGVRGHVLVWDAYMTPWFFHEGYSESKPPADRETMRLRLASYIDQVITHFEEKFPGTVYCWDVVNEAIGDNPGEWAEGDGRHLRTRRNGEINSFLEYVGEDYVEYSFLCARQTVEKLGADIKLFYNDYNLFFPEKRKAACELARSIQAYARDGEGNPLSLIDGMGMQGYMGGYGTQAGCLDPSIIPNVRQSIRAYADLGLEVQLTEMAVRNFDRSQADKHAAFCAKLFTDVFMQANGDQAAPLTAVCIWGLVDAPENAKGDYVYNLISPYGGLLTTEYKVKTCFDAIWQALKND